MFQDHPHDRLLSAVSASIVDGLLTAGRNYIFSVINDILVKVDPFPHKNAFPAVNVRNDFGNRRHCS